MAIDLYPASNLVLNTGIVGDNNDPNLQRPESPLWNPIFNADSTPREEVVHEGLENWDNNNIMELQCSNSNTKLNGYQPEPSSVTLAWHELCVYVPIKIHTRWGSTKKHEHRPFKRVLQNVTGIAQPGSLTAIIGSSGSGKTTLINMLAYRSQSDVAMTGSILANGLETGDFMSKISGYVHQDDLFYGSLTVLEHLHFMARMKMDRRLRGYEKVRRIEELLVELGLQKCKHTRIDSGISGGEKKRLSFAAEILTDPPILFCDEPTTGLDSYSAFKLVQMMKNMCTRKGKTIVCSIHQPSSRVFSMFDQICLIAEGRTIFMGDPTDGLSFLSSQGFQSPDHYNPADFFIHTTAVVPGKEEETRANIRMLSNKFLTSKHAREVEAKVDQELKTGLSQLKSLSKHRGTRAMDYEGLFGVDNLRRPLWLAKTFWVTNRAFLDSYRNPKIHMIRSIQKCLLGILIGLCFIGVNRMEQKGIQGVEGLLFIFINENSFPSMYACLSLFPMEFPIFLRENKAGLYDVSSYYLAKIISLIPGFVFEPIIFISIAYWMIGLSSSGYFLTCLTALLTANTASAFGCLFSTAFESFSISNSIISPVAFILMTLGGFYVSLSSLPIYIESLRYVSWFPYSYELLSIAQWNGVTNITCEFEPCLYTGEQVLLSKGFDVGNWANDLIGLASLYGIFHLLAYIALVYRIRKN